MARAVWEVRLALAGEPASGPPDQGGGEHRPLNSLENSYHLVTSLGGGAVVLCALLFLSWLVRLRDDARALSGQEPEYAGIRLYLGWVVPFVDLWAPTGSSRTRSGVRRRGGGCPSASTCGGCCG
ncbi:DUF4328 domain-containing protein [Streptomyces sp. NPDC006309]|uniref:DUF4328 domain-containing protein n=1 Tax=Streptomyces sp. NPDC006309 TaxID=3156749 RepID=UPI0033B06AD6